MKKRQDRKAWFIFTTSFPDMLPHMRLQITVVDTEGTAVENASIEFCVLNYSEYSPGALAVTDAQGNAVLETGMAPYMYRWKKTEFTQAKHSTAKKKVN